MSILILMIPITILFSLVFITGFIWAVRSGQFDDTVTPAHRILIEPERYKTNNNEDSNHKEGTKNERSPVTSS